MQLIKFKIAVILLIICIACEEDSKKTTESQTNKKGNTAEKGTIKVPPFHVFFPVKYVYTKLTLNESGGVKHIYNYSSDSLSLAFSCYEFSDSSEIIDSAMLEPMLAKMSYNLQSQYGEINWEKTQTGFLRSGGFFGKLKGELSNNYQLSMSFYRTNKHLAQLMTLADSANHQLANQVIASFKYDP